MITFLNQPKLSEHTIQSDSNKRRMSLLPHVESFLNQHPLFKDRDVQVFFPSAEAASFTCILDASGDKKVLKIPLSTKSFYKYEGTFLRAWEKVGVKVPHVLEEGIIDGSHYLLMDFIDAKTVQETYKKGEVLRKEMFVKMGEMLRIMHTAKSEGFGSIKNNKGNYKTFGEWLNNEIKSRKLEIDEISDDFPLAITIFNEYSGDSTQSSYCHNDYAYQNIFATDPLTVFDPIPILSHPYIDLASAITKAIGRGINSDEVSHQLMRGYSGDVLVLNRKALQAALVIQSHLIFTTWSQTGKEQGIKDMKTYL
ncbi:MAG: phosphotransferase, partial [Patescibacteria group bacterium]